MKDDTQFDWSLQKRQPDHRGTTWIFLLTAVASIAAVMAFIILGARIRPSVHSGYGGARIGWSGLYFHSQAGKEMETEMTDKEFVKAYVPFRDLKRAGFFDKSVKSTHYEAICQRFLTWFGTTKTEYAAGLPRLDMQLVPNFVTGKMADSVDKDGQLKKGEGFKLSLDS